jgi:hypothetical protein
MTISEVIALLQAFQDEHGDLWVETLETECACGNGITDGMEVVPSDFCTVTDEGGAVVALAIDLTGRGLAAPEAHE